MLTKLSYRPRDNESIHHYTRSILISRYHLFTPPEHMSTSPIGCISPARKWIIVNNCATIHATTHTHTHPHTLLLTSHGHSNEIPLSFSVKINNYYWHVCNSISSKYRKYISDKRPFRERDARYRAAAISSTVFSCTRRAYRSAPFVRAQRPPAARALSAGSRVVRVCVHWGEVIHGAFYLSPSFTATGSVARR